MLDFQAAADAGIDKTGRSSAVAVLVAQTQWDVSKKFDVMLGHVKFIFLCFSIYLYYYFYLFMLQRRLGHQVFLFL